MKQIKIWFIIMGILLATNLSMAADRGIPGDVENIIKQNASIEYPNDYKMQLSVIKKESEAYWVLQNSKPNDIYYQVFDEIKANAEKKYPEKYDTQLYSVKKDVNAYRQIENFKVSDIGISWPVFFKIKESAQGKYPGQYDMQLYEIKNEIKAYLKINR